MRRHLCLLLIVLSNGSYVSAGCYLTEWSAWSACQPAGGQCDPSSSSHSAPTRGPTARSRQTLEALERTMEEKRAHAWRVSRCRANGTCPQYGQWGDQLTLHECRHNVTRGGYPCYNVDQVAFLSIPTLVGPHVDHPSDITANDVWGWTDGVTGQEWVLVGLNVGTSVVLLSPTEPPTVRAFIPTRTQSSMWRAIKVLGDVMYIVSEADDHGLQYFDLTRLRDLRPEFTILYEDGQLKTFGSAHNIAANENSMYLYVVGARQNVKDHFENCNGGLHIIDVSTPLEPRFAGCYSDDGYTSDAQCVVYKGPHQEFQGKNVCFNFNEDTLTIVDVDTPASPILISITMYNGSAYSQQGWLTEDHEFLLLDDELDESYTKNKNTRTFVWDIKNLLQPKIIHTYCSNQKVIDHNQYVKGSFTYQSNYEAGLRILYIDRQDGVRLQEVGYFDVHPGEDQTAFMGAWGNYPYFDSGMIPVTSIERGLFILKPRMDLIEELARTGNVGSNVRSKLTSTRYRNYGQGRVAEDCRSEMLEETRGC